MKNLNLFKKVLLAPVVIALGATFLVAYAEPAMAQPAQALDQETKEDIQRHRAMSAAHEAAAKCLESGKKDDVCEKELQAACKGLAIGKYCGMKHVH